jgi:hypothetical protein
LLVVGNSADFHVGGHLLAAAAELGVRATAADVLSAYGRGMFQRAMWRVDRWPVHVRRFEREVIARCEQDRPRWLLATGTAPLRRAALDAVGALGVRRLVFLTDDPWNPAHASRWFRAALPAYDIVFTPRAIRGDLAEAGCRDVRYLAFGYNPAIHFPDPPGSPGADVLFVGGGDRDRAAVIGPLVRSGLNVTLYGGYWHRFSEVRQADRGLADPAAIRRATTAAKVALILVRRANRDGHVMRTFEAAACRGCLLVEDTPDHRELFGPDGECVTYFGSSRELIDRAQSLVADGPTGRRRLADAVHRRITEGQNKYVDRLRFILDVAQ